MSDKKYLGLGVIFKAIDKGFTKTSKDVQDSLSGTNKQMAGLQQSLDGLDFDRMNELFSTFQIFEKSISGTDPFGDLQSGLYELEDQLVNLTLAEKQIAQKKSLQNYLETLSSEGRITGEQFEALSKGLGDISSLNFPKPDIAALNEMNDFIKKQRDFAPRMANGLGVWSKSNLELELSVDKLNKVFEAQQKVKSINKYRLEMQNLHNQGKISTKDFQTINSDLNKLSNAFLKQADAPNMFFNNIYKKAKWVTGPIRDIGGALAGAAKTIIANLPSLTEGMIGKGEVSELGSKLDFLRTKMSLVMNPKQAQNFQNTMVGVMQTTGMTADQTSELAGAMNRYGVSVEDSAKYMPMLGDLVGKMGIDAKQVAEMGGQLTRTLGMSVEKSGELVNEFYEMGKARGFVDFLEDMPEITKETMVSFKKLGIVNKDVASKSIKSTAALTAMYRKMNIEQKAAVASSLKMQQALTGMSMDINRLSVGLEPENFEGMIDVAGEITRLSGKSADEAFQMIQRGAEDTNGFMQELMKIAGLPGTTEKDLTRLALIVEKNFDAEAANIIRNKDLREEAMKTSMEAVKADQKKRKDSTKDIRTDSEILAGTLKVSQELLDTNKKLTKAMAELSAKKGIIQSWTAQINEWRNLQESVAKQDIKGQMLSIAAAIEAGGAAAAAYMTGNDKLGESLARLGTDFRATSEAMRSLSGLTSAIQALGMILGGLGLGTILKTLSTLVPSFASLTSIAASIGSTLVAAIPAAVLVLAGGAAAAIGGALGNFLKEKFGWGSGKDAGSWIAKLTGTPAKTQEAQDQDAANKIAEANLDALKKRKEKEKIGGVVSSPSLPMVNDLEVPNVQPLMNQIGAPTVSKLPIATPQMSMAKTKGNTLDDVVKTLVEVRNSFVEEIKNVGNRPIYVELQGDAKKFFKAVSSENANKAGIMGLQNQVVFGG